MQRACTAGNALVGAHTPKPRRLPPTATPARCQAYEAAPAEAAHGAPSTGSEVSSLSCTMSLWRKPLANTGAPAPPVVALGKFDALHTGHRALAIAAAQLGGAPWLVSFAGIAEVLGWPERLPLVAPCDRPRVLESWADKCRRQVPGECTIPFAEVREMAPEAFVRMLAEELSVAGVVVGANYRFGYRAAGTAQLLQDIGPRYGLKVRVLELVQAEADTVVSSSGVRAALAAGDMGRVATLLDRPYRLVLSLQQQHISLEEGLGGRLRLALPIVCQNQPPGPGIYAVVTAGVGESVEPQHGRLVVSDGHATLESITVEPGQQQLALDFLV